MFRNLFKSIKNTKLPILSLGLIMGSNVRWDLQPYKYDVKKIYKNINFKDNKDKEKYYIGELEESYYYMVAKQILFTSVIENIDYVINQIMSNNDNIVVTIFDVSNFRLHKNYGKFYDYLNNCSTLNNTIINGDDINPLLKNHIAKIKLVDNQICVILEKVDLNVCGIKKNKC